MSCSRIQLRGAAAPFRVPAGRPPFPPRETPACLLFPMCLDTCCICTTSLIVGIRFPPKPPWGVMGGEGTGGHPGGPQTSTSMPTSVDTHALLFYFHELRQKPGFAPVEHRGGQGPATCPPWLRPSPHGAKKRKRAVDGRRGTTGEHQNPRAEALRSPVQANAAAARRNRRRAMRCGPTADSGQRAVGRDALLGAGEDKLPALKARPGHPAGMRPRPRAPPREAAGSPRA